MKTRPRIRRATLWSGVVLSALLAVLWLGSMVWYVDWQPAGSLCVGVGNAMVHVSGWGSRRVASFDSGRVRLPLVWWVRADHDALGWLLWIPLWMPLMVSLAVTAAAWRLEVLARRRERAGKCASCGYDRAGLKSGAVCPECGAAHGFVGENR